MAVRAMEIEEYAFSVEGDTDPKTVFHLTPMRKMEHFKVSAVIHNMFDAEKGELKTDTSVTEEAERVVYGYLREHLLRVENISVDGKLKSGKGEEYVERIDPNVAIEIVSDATQRAMVSKETEKN